MLSILLMAFIQTWYIYTSEFWEIWIHRVDIEHISDLIFGFSRAGVHVWRYFKYWVLDKIWALEYSIQETAFSNTSAAN